MSTDSERRAEIIFYEAIELLRAERDTFLSNACGADGELRAEVDELLRAHDAAAGFLPEDAPASPGLESDFNRLKPEEAGERIGNYKLLEQIGEGGFGTVWVAEQEVPVRRRVALKIIKPGMDTKEVIARFDQERQALAMMDHPNIARVLDAGATPFGRSYFVMELVRGIKITSYCDRAKLPTAERLRLFVQVCQAVQHAHQKGIIHRDLKPSNILVTLHDGVPVPKVIDFGVAKATQRQRLTDLTVYTQFEQMVGTPLYMSPEQAEMSGLDIDTRSDIYSLGVLLYELLAGRTPFDPETLMQRGLDEIRRAVREQEPQKPSTFVSTMALELRTNVAQHRQTDSTKLIGQIRGDLDWIVMKALEKDRARRYETATGLAQDIQRHLASEPVQARPASQLYRFRRFARRNSIAFAAGSAVLATLIVGLAISTWMFFKEKQARERAVAAEKAQKAEASKSGQVAQFLKHMLKGVGPSVALGRDTKMLREILDKTAERVGKDLHDQPEVEAELRNTLLGVYNELGDYEKAGAMASEALALRRRRFGNEHPDVAKSLNNLAVVLHGQGKLAEAETMYREALAMWRKLHGNESPDVAISLNNLANVLKQQGKLVESETMYRESLAMNRKLLGNEHREVAGSLYNLGLLLQDQDKDAEAETMHREALAMRRKLLDNAHPAVADSIDSLARVLLRQGKLAEAETMHREVLAMRRKLYGNEHPSVPSSLDILAIALYRQDKLAEAETMFRESLALYKKLLGDEHPDVTMSFRNLVSTLRVQHKWDEAETMLRELLALQIKLLGNEDPKVGAVRKDLADLLNDRGKQPAEVLSLLREALTIYRRLPADDPAKLEEVLYRLAEASWRQGLYAEAEPLYREILESRRGRLGASDSITEAAASLGRMLTERAWSERGSSGFQNRGPEITERAREAERLLRDCLAFRLRGTDVQWKTDDTRSRLGGALVAVAATDPDLSSEARQAKLAEAETLLMESNELLQNDKKVESKYKRDSLTRIVHLCEAREKPDKVTEWQRKVDAFDEARDKEAEPAAGTKAAAPGP